MRDSQDDAVTFREEHATRNEYFLEGMIVGIRDILLKVGLGKHAIEPKEV